MIMDMETGETNRDDETGELLPIRESLNLETGEIESLHTRKPFKIPSEYLPKPRDKQFYQPRKGAKDWSPAFLFLLPTLFVYPAVTSIIIALLEVILHVWAHKMNKKLVNEHVYFKSPMHIIASEFCAKCRDTKSMDKIEKLQDKRILRFKYNYDNWGEMESPPSCSTWSEAFILSDDSGLLLTSGSISSGSMSGDSRCQIALEYQNSDCEDKSLSQADSLDDMSDIMCGENFNTLKKGPNWCELSPKHTLAIAPPLEFRDKPSFINLPPHKIPKWLNALANQLVLTVIKDAIISCQKNVNYKPQFTHAQLKQVASRPYWTSDWLPFSPCHTATGRPSSRSSLGSSRLSCSHNSLSVPATCHADDSSFITQAVSHDTLTSNQISDLYNVPFDSDMYSVPVDTVKPPLRPKRIQIPRKRRRNTSSCQSNAPTQLKSSKNSQTFKLTAEITPGKRHSVPGTSIRHEDEPIHMTLAEVRQYLQTLYSNSSDSESKETLKTLKNKPDFDKTHTLLNHNNNKTRDNLTLIGKPFGAKSKNRKHSFVKSKKATDKRHISNNNLLEHEKKRCPVRNFPSNLKQTICNLFRFRRYVSPEKRTSRSMDDDATYDNDLLVSESDSRKGPLACRALPPLPPKERVHVPGDFASNIQRVKDYGWYWGPISSEAAEKILSNEPNGSFIVRDSSDDHYIFSLTFKLNSGVRHVRIEHDQGNFSFGSCTKFKSHTIIEFIENAVEHSRSGRYLFFLHRRPVLGPMRVQLLHPVSRFKQTQSLQHMCRFVILKLVRKDLISSLPLPRRIIDYLSTPHYYSEQLESDDSDPNHPMTRTPTNEEEEFVAEQQIIDNIRES